MTLISKTDIENELQTTLDAGYTDSIITDIADAAEDLLKLHTNRISFSGSTASLVTQAVLYLSIDRLVMSNRDLVKSSIESITENGATIKFNNGKTLQSYRDDALWIINSLRISGTQHVDMYIFEDTGGSEELY
jgi:hypothetical protein